MQNFNSGTTETNLKAELGTLKIWFNKYVVYNIVSFDKVEQVYTITYETVNDVFFAHNKEIGSNDGKMYLM